MKPIVLFVSVALGLAAGGGLVIAQTAAPTAKTATAVPAPAHEHDHGAAAGTPSDGMMCGKMMGGGMGPMMMGGGMGPMMMGGAAKVTVKNVERGVTMTFTADDPAGVARLQKMAEAMRLMHEAMSGH